MNWTPQKDVPPSPITPSHITEIHVSKKQSEGIINTPISLQISNSKRSLQFTHSLSHGDNISEISEGKFVFIVI